MSPPCWLALGLAALSQAAAQAPAPAAAATAALVALVDTPTVEARARTARELAARTDVALAQWLAAARTLPLRRTEPAVVDGRNRLYRVKLTRLGKEQSAEIHVRVPADAERRAGPLPLLFVGHAARGDGGQALAQWTALADRFGLLLAAPTETRQLYRDDGWSCHPDGYEGLFEALRFVRRTFRRRRGPHRARPRARRRPHAWDVGPTVDDKGELRLPTRVPVGKGYVPMAAEPGAPLQQAAQRKASRRTFDVRAGVREHSELLLLLPQQ